MKNMHEALLLHLAHFFENHNSTNEDSDIRKKSSSQQTNTKKETQVLITSCVVGKFQLFCI